jgi:hypothetical protein
MDNSINPFLYGNPVFPNNFIGRQFEIKRIVNRIKGYGQSTAIIGEPRIGKTSLLQYLFEPEMRDTLYGVDSEWQLFFSFIDLQGKLNSRFTESKFWEKALEPLHKKIKDSNLDSSLIEAYQLCQKNGFSDSDDLIKLFEQMKQAKLRLVLMLDECDVLLHHPTLNNPEFYGKLRAITSLHYSLCLVIASRLSLTKLNEATQSATGSPYFNFFNELNLGLLESNDIEILLNKAKEHFTSDDRQFIIQIAGNHPYLLQAIASILWETYEYKKELSTQQKRWELVGQKFYEETESILEYTWQTWTPSTRMALITATLAQLPDLLDDFRLELEGLKRTGFLMKDPEKPTGFRVCPRVFEWWLAYNLVNIVKNEKLFNEWLCKQELDGIVIKSKREKIRGTMQATIKTIGISSSIVTLFEFIRIALLGI